MKMRGRDSDSEPPKRSLPSARNPTSITTCLLSVSETCPFLGLQTNSPKPLPIEILILGCGKFIEPVGPELQRFIRSTGMKLEAIDLKNAVSTYNILNEEGRIVAAALLPYGVSS
ncbi:hypothetical protein M0R45_035296 [Rubus argutus]|uniref:NADH dehydrogenase [ubiquinone] 1 alpha subcomplex assembly factor 3 n=1 Tax=Rubus argutus TaxID=59490 RepID=A0AAW1VY29_RUBAR